MLFFSVIVPTCDRDAELALCLERLAPGDQILAAESYEVIVTDDGINSMTEKLLRTKFPWARWTQGPRRGPAANRNHGAAQARGEWLVFTDDDCLPAVHWLSAYEAAAQGRPGTDVLEGRTLACGVRASIDMEAPVNAHGGFLWSCNFAIRRRLFESLEGFDAGFPGPTMEDVELCLRLRQRGVELSFVEQAVVEHPWRRHRGFRFLHVYAASVDYYLRKHPGQRGHFTAPRQLRILAGAVYRRAREAFKVCRGRGLVRFVALETYSWMLITWKNIVRPAPRNLPAVPAP
jgi:GT2 family glycosyltransferase